MTDYLGDKKNFDKSCEGSSSGITRMKGLRSKRRILLIYLLGSESILWYFAVLIITRNMGHFAPARL